MNNYCGANCERCPSRETCRGCRATCGSPFGGSCIAARYIRAGGIEAYRQFKNQLTEEINALLRARDLPAADGLTELVGGQVNLSYRLPSGKYVQFLKEENIYLGTQIEFADLGICYGVVADASFILICSYSVNGSEPEIVLYQRR